MSLRTLMTSARRPCIGVFDSGFGGLTVLKELIALAPEADYIYFGDTARLPYGSKSAETVARYAIGAAQYLEQHGAQMLVIACNTATALALDQIKQASGVPVVGVVEPGAARAAAVSQVRRVVVIGTEATVTSHAYAKALQAQGIEAAEKACPLFVPLVEEGWSEHSVAEQVARIYLDQAFTGDFKSADVLVLGCTHYPLLKASAAEAGARPRDYRGFCRLHGPRGQRFTPQRLAKAFFRSRTPRNTSPEILRDRFSGEIPPHGRAVPGQSDRRCGARGAERVVLKPLRTEVPRRKSLGLLLRGTSCP